jgi:hypothetical protein
MFPCTSGFGQRALAGQDIQWADGPCENWQDWHGRWVLVGGALLMTQRPHSDLRAVAALVAAERRLVVPHHKHHCEQDLIGVMRTIKQQVPAMAAYWRFG